MKKPKMFIVLAAVGAVLSVYGVKTILGTIESRNWPHCIGTVTESKVHHSTTTSRTGKTRTIHDIYRPRVRYKYVLDDLEYISNGITFGGHIGRRQAAQKIVDYYSVGKKVKVYVNPDNPRQSVLDPGSWSVGPLAPGFLLFELSYLVFKSDKKKTDSVLDLSDL